VLESISVGEFYNVPGSIGYAVCHAACRLYPLCSDY